MNDRLENEIEHGKYLLAQGAGEVWNWETPAGRIRWARRVKMLTEHLRPRDKVLELGCGTGYFTSALAKTGAQITAIDISPDLLRVAREKCARPNVSFEIQNAYSLSYGDETFDAVVGSSVLHHLEVDSALREIHRVLKRGGSIRFTEPNMMNPQIAVQKNIPPIKRRWAILPMKQLSFGGHCDAKWRRVASLKYRSEPFDFLHPRVSAGWIPRLQTIGDIMEKIPLLGEIAGSLYIQARK